MPDENIEVAPSEDNGNVPADAPSEQPKAEPVPPEPSVPAEPAAPEATPTELFDLPDGRKVDAATLAKEFKENFLPEFTRKSQELSQLKTGQLPEQKPQSPYADPNYVPQSYDEIIQAAKEAALAEIKQAEEAKVQQAQEIENQVVAQLEQVKTLDPKVNENQLFLHANKYGFRDLVAAYKNMKDMSEVVKTVKQQTADDLKKRQDPVSVSPGATGAKPDPSGFGNAIDYLRSLKT